MQRSKTENDSRGLIMIELTHAFPLRLTYYSRYVPPCTLQWYPASGIRHPVSFYGNLLTQHLFDFQTSFNFNLPSL